MKPRIAVTVMHVSSDPRRRVFLRDLVTALGGLGEIHAHTTAWRIADDPTKRGIRWNFHQAWRGLIMNARGATHGIVLSEDFAPAPDLLRALNYFATLDGHSGGPAANPVNLYQGRKSYIARADAAHSAWVTARDAPYGGATLWPLDLAWDKIRWIEQNIDPAFPNDDECQSMFLLASGTDRRLWIANPSLLEHTGRGHSTVGHSAVLNGHGAAKADLTTSALDHDWTRGLDDPPHIATHSLGKPAQRVLARLRTKEPTP